MPPLRATPLQLAAVGALALVLMVPGATACSLVHQPFAGAAFHGGELWYEELSELRHVQQGRETVVAEGYFLSFAVLPDDRLLVAGQDGLGGDCSGVGWLELRDGDDVVWRRQHDAQVFAHAAGPFVAIQEGDRFDSREAPTLWRLEGDDLVAVGTGREPGWLLGFSAAGEPIEAADNGVHVGNRFIHLGDNNGVAAAGARGHEVAILERVLEGPATLHVLDGDGVGTRTWDVGDAWGTAVAPAGPDAWAVALGGRAYRVRDDGVHDLGIADVRTVAAHGEDGAVAVFTEAGYVVVEGDKSVSAWQRDGASWRPVAAPTTSQRPVPSTAGDGTVLHASSTSGSGSDDTGGDVWSVPASGSWAILALGGSLLVAAVRRRLA